VDAKTSKVAAGPAKLGIVKARAKGDAPAGIIKPVIPIVTNKQPLQQITNKGGARKDSDGDDDDDGYGSDGFDEDDGGEDNTVKNVLKGLVKENKRTEKYIEKKATGVPTSSGPSAGGSSMGQKIA
jgi:hypothetical protein